MVNHDLLIDVGNRSKHSQHTTKGLSQNVIGALRLDATCRRYTRLYVIVAFIAIALVGAGLWKWALDTPAIVDPFSPKITAAMQFPLYYPTHVPTGYHIDSKSVTVPQQGIVVFTLLGPNQSKIYISEEARPSTYNLGGFYGTFTGLKETPVEDGSIAVGRINSNQTEIASRANNKVWILSNTTAKIPLNQLSDMLKTMTVSY